MSSGFIAIAATPSVLAAQTANGSADLYDRPGATPPFERLGTAEAEFIAARDSFYMASVSETGWPYVQHRGGPAGFLKVIDGHTLAFPDFRGNRQYISLGNTAADNRIAVILVDYSHRRRLKLYARVEHRDLAHDPDLAARLALPGYRGLVERALLLHVQAFDWNCPQHITPRFTQTEVSAASAPMIARLAILEDENRKLRSALAEREPGK
jgi:predicted pyridoxine 5'-phosphate oxidase superfamily flavin-nucleotide-binding protein